MGEREAVRAGSLDDFRSLLSFTRRGELLPSPELEPFNAITATSSENLNKVSIGKIFVIIHGEKR